MKDQITETLVGLLVLAVAAGFSWFVFSTIGKSSNKDALDVVASFSSIGSITNGTDVRLAGVKVGTVTDISLDTQTYDANVILSIRSGIPVPEDSVAKIVSDGLLGAAYISIEPGASEDMLTAGSSFEYTQGAVDLLGLLGQFAGNGSGADSSE